MGSRPAETLGIAELARRAGVTVRTVRYYVAEGLLPPPGGAGPRRVYTLDHLLRLEAIKRLKADYLPLGEIRRRLAGLSTAELERLLQAMERDRPEGDGPEYVPPIVLPPSALRAGVLGAHAFVAPPGQESPRRAVGLDAPRRPAVVPGSGRAASKTPPSTTWQRVTLAPGVELHYQLSGDPRRDEAIDRLIRSAARLLDDNPSSGERPSPFGF